MSTTILVGVDASDSSTRAVRHAARLSAGADTTLVVAHVIHWSPFTFNTPMENEERHLRRTEEIAQAEEHIIAPMAKIADEAGLTVRTEIRHGQPARTLVALAQEAGADQIVVGRTGDSGFHDAVFGSVVGRLAQTSPIPVTVVP